MGDNGLLDELLDLEHRGWQSLCDGTGATFYGDLMAADGVMVLAHGMVMDREQVMASLGDAPPWDRYEITDPRLVDVDGGAALVYTGAGHRGDETFVALMSSVYVRQDDRWRLALYQQTPVLA